MDDEGVGRQIQRAQHGGQYTRQRELSSEWIEVSNTEGEVAEIATKRLEEQGHVKWLLAPLSPETPRVVEDSVGTITPIGEDWVVGDDNNPVSKIALSNCQQKLMNHRVRLWAQPRLGPALENQNPNLGCHIYLHWSLCQLGVHIPFPKLIAHNAHRCRNTWARKERFREERRCGQYSLLPVKHSQQLS